MVTKSIIETPFGSKFIYRIDGECVWSEYIQFDKISESSLSHRLFAQVRRAWGAVSRVVHMACGL